MYCLQQIQFRKACREQAFFCPKETMLITETGAGLPNAESYASVALAK